MIRLLVLDVDGVLTDGSILLDDQGVETKRFYVRDGLGIRLWQKVGNHVAIITGRSGQATLYRARELSIELIIQDANDKLQSFQQLTQQLGIGMHETAVMGDDLPDLSMLRAAGCAIAVADAANEVRRAADFVTTQSGGRGAVREAIEHLLKQQSQWHRVANDPAGT